jgi:tRNA A37 threonylcarbamoyladenosine modification protein TsaB
MILYINTIKDNAEKIEVKIIHDKKELASRVVSAHTKQSEKLIPAITKLLRDTKINITEIKQIKVENYGGSFTSLRIGVTTANALGYALQIPVSGAVKAEKNASAKLPFSIVEPMYNRNPDITISKKNLIGS